MAAGSIQTRVWFVRENDITAHTRTHNSDDVAVVATSAATPWMNFNREFI